ncbi:MAG: hypothetical protein IM602_15400 [Cytophagales bacterium]|jgi:hypothetical protein|nr:hypothetical protein [Cytophagales bacterium]MCA6427029.1 hypothetical protein [Cytophagales bacterium]
MKRLLPTFLILLFAVQSIGQKRYCFCDKNKLMNGATVSCDTTFFTNDSFIYWQYNCDKIWLTLENKGKHKFEIAEVPVDLFNLTYRLGYHLIKEYKSSLLFRKGCSASGPCTYDLIDKNDGKKLRDFGQLICIDTDSRRTNSHPYNFEFIVYFETTDNIIVEYIDSGQKFKIPFNEKLTDIVPELQFNEMTLVNNRLTLTYKTDKENKTWTGELK